MFFKNKKQRFLPGIKALTDRRNIRVKLFYQGKAEIDKLLSKIQKVYYGILSGFLLIELVIVSSIILFHSKSLLVNVLLATLVMVFLLQVVFFITMRSILAQELLVKFFAIGYLVFKKGVLNLSPDITNAPSWYGYIARKIFKSKKFTKDEDETFAILAEDWNGTYGDLLVTVRTL